MNKEKQQRITAYVLENIQKKLTLDDLAAVVAMSKFHFARSFRLSFGTTPGRYICQVRAERAKELLRDGEPISSVISAVGYSSHSHMIAGFRRLNCEKPSFYRQ